MNEALANLHRAVREVEEIQDSRKQIANALHLFLNIYTKHTLKNRDVLNPLLERLDRLIPIPCKYAHVIGQPISLRNLVVGMGPQAASLVILAITYDIEDSDLVTLHDVTDDNGDHTITLECHSKSGDPHLLHDVPLEQFVFPILFHHLSDTFYTTEWIMKDGTRVPIGDDAVTSWPKVFGSLNEFAAKHHKKLRKSE